MIKKFVLIIVFSLIIVISSVYIADIVVQYFINTISTSSKDVMNEASQDTSAESSQKNPQDSSSQNVKSKKVSPDYEPEKYNFKWEVFKENNLVNDYKRDYNLAFGSSEEYSEVEGVVSFRGNNYRNSPSFGFADIQQKKLEKVWSSKIGRIDEWTGVGWTGQPVIVKWDNTLKNKMNIFPEKKQKANLKEVIYATLDGKIYFMDIDDGSYTRAPINVGAPHKGSVSVDPRGYPLLYAGQGIDTVAGKRVAIGYRIFSLIDQKLLHFIDGFDKVALRKWGAFDSNSLVDKKTDTLIECGENGLIYTLKLNTKFDSKNGRISINPEATKYRYTSPKSTQLGTENSIAIYKNFGYFIDNSGLLQCLDLNTFSPVWVRYVSDDTDSTITLEEGENSEVYLYTACEVDKQGANGHSYVRKLNALTGDLIWEKSYKCSYDTHTNGGALATPVVGKKDIENLVIFNIAKTGDKNNGGTLVAFDKKTGKEVWVINLQNYCWSSPVDVYTRDGKAYLIVCDSGGFMSLIDGKNGNILDKIPLEANIEASPAVFNDMIVVGTRGQKIWGIKIK